MMSDDLRQHHKPPVAVVPKELEEVVRAGVKGGTTISGAVALGGTVCSLYAAHRISYDIDFVVKDLRERFEDVSESLEALPGWVVKKTRPPVLILGKLDGIDIGYRQLRRTAPLDTIELVTADGKLVIPTLEELLRVKAFLACERNYTRDFFDFAELSSLLPREKVIEALVLLDEKIGWEQRPTVTLEVIKTLADCSPCDKETHGFDTFRSLKPRMKSWKDIEATCRAISVDLSAKFIEGRK
jgi:hypothetical protein